MTRFSCAAASSPSIRSCGVRTIRVARADEQQIRFQIAVEVVLLTVSQDVLRVVFFGDDPGQVGFELEDISARVRKDRLERRLRTGEAGQEDTDENNQAPGSSRAHERSSGLDGAPSSRKTTTIRGTRGVQPCSR